MLRQGAGSPNIIQQIHTLKLGEHNTLSEIRYIGPRGRRQDPPEEIKSCVRWHSLSTLLNICQFLITLYNVHYVHCCDYLIHVLKLCAMRTWSVAAWFYISSG